jgi:hypothetical protein
MRFLHLTMKKWLPLLALPLLLFSCIKEKYAIEYGEDNTQRLITEFEGAKDTLISKAIDAATGISVVELINLQSVSRSVIEQSYTVKLSVNNALLTAYNNNNGTNFILPPAAAITLETLDFSISKERRVIPVIARINSTSLIGNDYAIPLTITQVGSGEISKLSQNVIVAISVKNAYDANYRSVGSRTSHGGPSPSDPVTAVFPYDYTKTLVTVNANTCTMFTADNVDDMYITVNPDNSVTCSTSPFGAFPTSNEGPCSYNPTTRVFTLNYKYFNSAGNYRKMVETLTRI